MSLNSFFIFAYKDPIKDNDFYILNIMDINYIQLDQSVAKEERVILDVSYNYDNTFNETRYYIENQAEVLNDLAQKMNVFFINFRDISYCKFNIKYINYNSDTGSGIIIMRDGSHYSIHSDGMNTQMKDTIIKNFKKEE